MLCITRTIMLSQDVSPRGYSVETAKHIIKLFSPSGYSHTILAFFVPNGMAILGGHGPPYLGR